MVLAPMIDMAPPYQLSVDGLAGDLFQMRSFSENETISKAYDLEVVVTAEAGDAVERTPWAGARSSPLHVGPQPRLFHGVVTAVRVAGGDRGDHQIEYALRLPRLWLLKRRWRTRIFQTMRESDVVTRGPGRGRDGRALDVQRARPAAPHAVPNQAVALNAGRCRSSRTAPSLPRSRAAPDGSCAWPSRSSRTIRQSTAHWRIHSASRIRRGSCHSRPCRPASCRRRTR
ncbi:contractile injection system protein, VgrG/Pvc8 family [Sorangium sp. So ce124]|uniref:contractile injection system protein, VgrG/Pvc8 family n=1 Tax=Sorangium sp. So ce124 TaxID=3133280 RepID=UPI003F5DF129